MSIETMTKLDSYTVGAGGVSSVTFSNIPQTYTDLVVKISARGSTSAVTTSLLLSLNGTTSGNAYTILYGNSNAAYSFTGSDTFAGDINAASTTSNTFSSTEIYLTNYTSSNYKMGSIESVIENNSGSTNNSYIELFGERWELSSAINSLVFTLSAGNFSQYSTFTLYGVKAARAFDKNKATGGTVTFDGTYYYHSFASTGTFIPKQDLTADVLIVAGGGTGGRANVGSAGGGGAGGLLQYLSTPLTLGTTYTCTVGAGGAAPGSYTNGNAGNNSTFTGLTSAVGGGYGGVSVVEGTGGAGGSGGSGGGGARWGYNGTASGGSGTSGQGNAGGNAQASNTGGHNSGGGGGAGAAASNSNNGGPTTAGGIGATSSLINAIGAATGYGQNVSGTYYFAGGGGGGDSYGSAAGGYGGGGAGATNGTGTGIDSSGSTPGTANTGGGSGGAGAVYASINGANGGSGIIVVRYRA